MPANPATKTSTYTPENATVDHALTVLASCEKTVGSFLKSFDQEESGGRGRGTTSDIEQDLLRALLIFAAAGLDAVVKQLISDCLSTILAKNDAARNMLAKYTKDIITTKLGDAKTTNPDILSQILLQDNPRNFIRHRLIHDLKSGSLQSRNELFRIAAHFDIPSKDLTRDYDLLDSIFKIRNVIIHEMDTDLTLPRPNRNQRQRNDMVNHANILLDIALTFIQKTDKKLSELSEGLEADTYDRT